ncbi:hypothetical protein PR048_028513 [Dryococelus australis]|uniref:Uncharacterized protein n=1 Tax=Dryococelus australis TaxID=614101 RepID=A0ABQ9GBG7_9NEOP|nr:hypothetical protein PR048_028513 [Dryococelus australis]
MLNTPGGNSLITAGGCTQIGHRLAERIRSHGLGGSPNHTASSPRKRDAVSDHGRRRYAVPKCAPSFFQPNGNYAQASVAERCAWKQIKMCTYYSFIVRVRNMEEDCVSRVADAHVDLLIFSTGVRCFPGVGNPTRLHFSISFYVTLQKQRGPHVGGKGAPRWLSG